MKKLVLAAALLAAPPLYAQQRVAYWEPITLSGKIDMLPGTDLQLGKGVRVKFLAIVLDHAITAGTEPGDPDTPLATTGIVQLSATGKNFETLKRLRGQRAAVECQDLFPSATAHHFEPILCTVERVITP